MRAVIFTVVSLAAAALAQNCGPEYNNQVCAAGNCCSQYGWVRHLISISTIVPMRFADHVIVVRYLARPLRPSHMSEAILRRRIKLRGLLLCSTTPFPPWRLIIPTELGRIILIQHVQRTRRIQLLAILPLRLHRPGHRRVRLGRRRRLLPRRGHQQLLLPLLLVGRALRAQERHPGPGHLLRRRLPGRLREMRLHVQAARARDRARRRPERRDVRAHRQQEVRGGLVLLGQQFLRDVGGLLRECELVPA